MGYGGSYTGRYFGDDDFSFGRGYHRNEWTLGDFHAYTDKFKGVGVIFDTYVNDVAQHKDVTMVWNDGTRDVETLYATAVGCNAKVRYHEGRDDFEPAKATTRAKIVLSERGRAVTVYVDERNEGIWRVCGTLELPETTPLDWAKEAHVGLTSSTGELSDNHDVIRLETYANEGAAEEAESERREDPHVKGGNKLVGEVEEEATVEERVARLEKLLSLMLVKMERLEHDTEHKFEDMKDYVDESDNRMTGHERSLEDAIKALDTQVKEHEVRLKGELNSKIDIAVEDVGQWKRPFIAILLLLGVAMAVLSRWYRKLIKSHLL